MKELTINDITLVGYISKIRELKQINERNCVIDVNIYTIEGRGDRTRKVYHNLKLWNDNANWAATHLTVGDKIFIKGVLLTDIYSKKGEGNKSYTYVNVYSIIVINVEDGAIPEVDDDIPF